jgi:hypothetical protein
VHSRAEAADRANRRRRFRTKKFGGGKLNAYKKSLTERELRTTRHE